MVRPIDTTTSSIFREVAESKTSTSLSGSKTTSVDSLFLSSDPDFLIWNYFRSSPTHRVTLREFVFPNIKSWLSIRLILAWSNRKEIPDAYSAAVDLLAECANITFFEETAKYLEAASLLAASNAISLVKLDNFWEVFIKGVSYASKISPENRLQLIANLCPTVHRINRRVIKAALIDALIVLLDDTSTERVYSLVSFFVSDFESDMYVREYAEEALQEIQ